MTEIAQIVSKRGVLPSQHIAALIGEEVIRGTPAIDPAQIQPASLDLRLGPRAYRVRASFLPGKGGTVAGRLAEFAMHEIDLGQGAALETGCVYLVELMESLHLPEQIQAVANAKSSTGRLDVFTRLITDNGTAFDQIPAGYQGPLYAEISPRTFSVLVKAGAKLNQIRFRVGDAGYSGEALARLHARERLVDADAHIDDSGVAFSVDLLARGEKPVGFLARRHAGLIDLSRIGHYSVHDFWEPIFPRREGRVILDPGAFYILASREAVHVPPSCAAEMTPYSALVGEFRVHYAGFFDPGFGHDAAGGAGARGVLEVRCHEVPFVLEHAQTVGRLVYEAMQSPPDKLYGVDLGSNYQAQGLKLSKHFAAG